MGRLDDARWQELSPLLDRALELDGATLQSWLGELEAEDAARAADLRQLLTERRALRASGFLEGSALPPSHETLAGQTIGAYTLESVIGEGGMGTVWLARRSDGRFEGRAAVKLLNLALVGPQGLARFEREGQLRPALREGHHRCDAERRLRRGHAHARQAQLAAGDVDAARTSVGRATETLRNGLGAEHALSGQSEQLASRLR